MSAAPEAPPVARGSLAWAFVAPALVALVVGAAWAGRGGPEPSDPLSAPVASRDLGTIPAFRLVERSGQPFGSADLAGKPWIAGFAFTRCSGPCPRLTAAMARVQGELAREADLRLVTISVDPEHDLPEVLARYAAGFKIEAPERWFFLTGEAPRVASLLRDGFHLPVVKDPTLAPGEAVTHSTRLALVGRDGHLRGYYDSLDEESLASLVRDARALAAPVSTGRQSVLPSVNAALNATSAVLLLLGFALIRAGRPGAHRAAMLGALAVSAAFLTCYLVYHARHGSTRFEGGGWVRPAYFAILISHVILAVPLVPLALATVVLGHRGSWPRHRTFARITFPLWLYVSVTGVAVYLLLYVIDRPGGLS